MAEANMGGSPRASEVTQLLDQASEGNRAAFNQLLPHVYDELRQLAASRLRYERDSHTLNATALVHEAYVRLVGQERVKWQGRAHFFAIASQAMRRILMNYAEARNAQKRGGKAVHVGLDEAAVSMGDELATELLALNEALNNLERFNERGAKVVEYRFFGGLSNNEIAEAMGLSEVTVRRAWRAARAWLRDALAPSVTLSWAGGAGVLPTAAPSSRKV
ncbi:MAG: ECF-type sigma factor [Longimicrobiales bacterium]